jgi:hypothetical protein
MKRQMTLLERRYDSERSALKKVMMSAGRKPVQEGVRSSFLRE